MSRQRPRIPGTPSRPRVLFVLPPIQDELDEATKDGLAIRNAASTSGVCPDCGAKGELEGPDEHGLLHLTFRHEDACHAFLDEDAAA